MADADSGSAAGATTNTATARSPRILGSLVLSLLILAGCGPSEAELQERIDRAVDERLATTTQPMVTSTEFASTTEVVSTIRSATTTVNPGEGALAEAYDLLRTWELTVAGGLPRGQLNAQWPGVSAELARQLETLTGPDEQALALDFARTMWQDCHEAVNRVLTPRTDHRTYEGQILLLQRQIADILYEDVACRDSFLAMDAVRVTLGDQAHFTDTEPPSMSGEEYRGLPVLLQPYGVSLGELGQLPFGYPADRTIRMLEAWLGDAEIDSSWVETEPSIQCYGQLEVGTGSITHHRMVEWPGFTAHFVRDPEVPMDTTDVEHFSAFILGANWSSVNLWDAEYPSMKLATPEGISAGSSLGELRSAYPPSEGRERVRVFESQNYFAVYDIFPFGDELLYEGLLGPYLDGVETVAAGRWCRDGQA